MGKLLRMIGAFFCLLIAGLIYKIAMPSSSCSEGLLCNNKGWNANTYTALVAIIGLISLAVWLLYKVKSKKF